MLLVWIISALINLVFISLGVKHVASYTRQLNYSGIAHFILYGIILGPMFTLLIAVYGLAEWATKE